MDQAYVLAFAAVLLNSDLHNPMNPRHMTIPEFVSSIQNTVAKDSITDAALVDLYQSIRTNPFTFKSSEGDEVLAMTAPSMKGPLEKKGSDFFSLWVEHFFVLSNSCMYYFSPRSRSMADPDPLGVIQLVSVDVSAVDKTQIKVVATEGDLQYVKFRPGKPPRYVAGRQYVIFRAKNQTLRDKWLYRMKTSVGGFQLGAMSFGEAPDPHRRPTDDDDYLFEWNGRGRRSRNRQAAAGPAPAALARASRAQTVRGPPPPLAARPAATVSIPRPTSKRRSSLSDDGFDAVPDVPPRRATNEADPDALVIEAAPRPPRRMMVVSFAEPKPESPEKENPKEEEGEKPPVQEGDGVKVETEEPPPAEETGAGGDAEQGSTGGLPKVAGGSNEVEEVGTVSGESDKVGDGEPAPDQSGKAEGGRESKESSEGSNDDESSSDSESTSYESSTTSSDTEVNEDGSD
jgi:hypothetical protein